jgi:hypothetical protein
MQGERRQALRTRNWEGRVMTAVGIDSWGREEYHRRAYRRCRLSVTRENILMGWRRQDRKKENKKVQKEVGRETKHGIATTF